MFRITEGLKVDVGLISQALNNTNATGEYHPMNDYRRAAVVLSGGAMAKTKTTKIEFLQAIDQAGTSAKAISTAEATITANALVTELTITCATVLNTETVTINTLVFTAHTDTTTLASRQFSIAGNDTADAAQLVLCINDATYGVPGVTATSALGVVTLKADPRGEATITAASTDATFTVATTAAQAYVELNGGDLDHANSFDHIAVKVTTTANSNVAAVLLRSPREMPAGQEVGASAVI
ncbi:MAG: hypothetical protein KAY32_10540 [Candidatus Eisenbacteria sp.]|nr:hypothetical protein [Candidatus Eisenbacteria bacterium]